MAKRAAKKIHLRVTIDESFAKHLVRAGVAKQLVDGRLAVDGEDRQKVIVALAVSAAGKLMQRRMEDATFIKTGCALPVPVLPFDHEGNRRPHDGKPYMSAAMAAKRAERTAAEMFTLWCQTMTECGH